jgi:preprotein translocase subunit SecA
MRQAVRSQPQPADVDDHAGHDHSGHDHSGHDHGPLIKAKGLEPRRQPQNLSYSAPTEQGEVEVKSSTAGNADDPFAKVGRNAQCPCGSGKKYKMCHGRPGGPTGLTARAAGG